MGSAINAAIFSAPRLSTKSENSLIFSSHQVFSLIPSGRIKGFTLPRKCTRVLPMSIKLLSRSLPETLEDKNVEP